MPFSAVLARFAAAFANARFASARTFFDDWEGAGGRGADEDAPAPACGRDPGPSSDANRAAAALAAGDETMAVAAVGTLCPPAAGAAATGPADVRIAIAGVTIGALDWRGEVSSIFVGGGGGKGG